LKRRERATSATPKQGGRKRAPRTASSPSPRDDRSLPLAHGAFLFALALGLRLAHVLAMRQSPYFDHPIVDAYTYQQAARAIAAGTGHPDKIFWQPPGYPYFLGFLYWATGSVNFVLPRIVQSVLGAISTVLTAWIGARLFGRTVGLAAGLAVAFYGTLIYFDGELLAVSLTVALQLGSVALALLALMRNRTFALWAGAGFLAGLASITTATSIVLVLALAVAARRLAPWCLLGVAIAIAPVTIRNAALGHEWIPISWNGGVNFFIGNNPHYDDVVAIRPDRQWRDLTAEPERHGIWTKAGASSYFVRKVTAWAREDPAAFLKLQLRKIRLLLGGDEIFRNQMIYPARSDSPLLRALLWKWPGIAFPWGIVVPIALVGLAVSWKRAPLLGWILVLEALANVAFFITARYRVPMVPYLAIFAAAGVRWFVRDAKRPARTVAIGGAVAAYAVCNLGQGTMPARMNPDAELTLAGFLHQEGRLDEARVHYERSLEGNPGDPETWTDLAALDADLGQAADAESAFQHALSLDAGNGGALLGLAMLREREHRIEDAVHLYERAAASEATYAWAARRAAALRRHFGIADSGSAGTEKPEARATSRP